jgi:Carboxypeptidase regulatory-like domain
MNKFINYLLAASRKLPMLCFLIMLSVSQLAQAQVLYGSLVGRVEDPSGAIVPGAKISVTNKATGQQRDVTADDGGSFAIRDLQVGVYDIKVTQSGFKSYSKESVNISLNNTVREDVRMEVGSASESVTITAEAPMLQTDRADVSTQLDKAQISNLPIGAGRNFQQLYKLIPGASSPADQHSDAGNPQRALVTNFNGVSYSNNNTRLDGATVSYPWLPHIVAYVPPQDAVEVVNVVTNSFDAERWRSGQRANQSRHESISRQHARISYQQPDESAQLFLLSTRHLAEKYFQSVRRHVRRPHHQK